jgi:uncharacterized DUF497 family protein
VPYLVNQLLATEVALDKLGARGISLDEAEQVIWNRHAVVKNRRGSPADVEIVGSSRDRDLVVQFTLEGADAVALQKIATRQGERPGEVVRSLIRAASDRAA